MLESNISQYANCYKRQKSYKSFVTAWRDEIYYSRFTERGSPLQIIHHSVTQKTSLAQKHLILVNLFPFMMETLQYILPVHPPIVAELPHT